MRFFFRVLDFFGFFFFDFLVCFCCGVLFCWFFLWLGFCGFFFCLVLFVVFCLLFVFLRGVCLFDFLVRFGFFSLAMGCGSQTSPSQQAADATSCEQAGLAGTVALPGLDGLSDRWTEGWRAEQGCQGLLQPLPPAVSLRAAIHRECPRTRVHGCYRHCRHASSSFMGNFDYSKR